MPKVYTITEDELVEQIKRICRRNLGRGDVKVCEECCLLEERISIMKSRGWKVHEKYDAVIKDRLFDKILNELSSIEGLEERAWTIYPDSEEPLKDFIKNWDEHAEEFKGKLQDEVYNKVENAYQEYKQI